MADDGSQEELKPYCSDVMRRVFALVKSANALPKVGQNYELYAGSRQFCGFLKAEQEFLLDLLGKVLCQSGCKTRIGGRGHCDPEELLDQLVDAGDALVERIGIALDEAELVSRGKATQQSNLLASPKTFNVRQAETKTNNVSNSASKSTSFAIQKPQIKYKFLNLIDNKDEPLKSKLKVKHNERKHDAGGITVIDCDESAGGSKWTANSDAVESLHPYQFELDKFRPNFAGLSSNLKKFEGKKSKLLEETPLIFVDSVESLENLVDELKKCREFAVDLESQHNSERSYVGITCLIQISTRQTDYIVDPFPIWAQLWRLNDPFTDPKIVKIFHGSESDVEWLQRDFGVFLVNLFDTGCAMKLTNFSRFSLQHLLATLADVNLDKEHQRSDWRIRPLPMDMVKYARSDSHYLIECYEKLTKMLVEQNSGGTDLLAKAFMLSRDICLKLYSKSAFDADGYRNLLGKRSFLNNRQIFALKSLWSWRDKTARDEDESVHFVLPAHMMLQIAEVLPKDGQGILACCNPVPRLLRRGLNEVGQFVIDARNRPLEQTVDSDKPRLVTVERDRPHWLYDLLDYSHTGREEELICPTIKEIETEVLVKEKIRAELNIFESPIRNAEIFEPPDDWISPFEMYQLAMEKVEEKKKRKAENSVERNENSEKAKKKKTRFTHRDEETGQVVNQKITSTTEETLNSGLADVEGKKRRKRKSVPDVSTNPAKVLKEPFDYEKNASKLFAKEKRKKGQKSTVYDPYTKLSGVEAAKQKGKNRLKNRFSQSNLSTKKRDK